MWSVASLWLTQCMLVVHAMPLASAAAVQQSGTREVSKGETPRDRTIYIGVCLLCLLVSSTLLGSRFSKLRQNAVRARHITSILVLILYFIVIVLIISSALMLSGQGLLNFAQCHAITWICLALYGLAKFIVYLFLVERIRVIRAPFVCRSKDWLYWGCFITVMFSLLGMVINSYLRAQTEIRTNGRCYIGIPGTASIPNLIINTLVDAVMTGVYLYLLRPLITSTGLNPITSLYTNTFKIPKLNNGQKRRVRSETTAQKNLKIILWKSIIGGLLTMLPMIANMIQLMLTKGRELAIICLAMCVVDVTWDAIILHWITMGSAKAEKDLPKENMNAARAVRSISGSSIDPMVSTLDNTLDEIENMAHKSKVICKDSVIDKGQTTKDVATPVDVR